MHQKTQQHIHTLSEFFFFLIGFLYAIGFLLKENGIAVIPFKYFLQITDGAFLFTALLYFFLSLLLRQKENFLNTRINANQKKDFFWIELAYLSIGMLVFLLYLSIKLFA